MAGGASRGDDGEMGRSADDGQEQPSAPRPAVLLKASSAGSSGPGGACREGRDGPAGAELRPSEERGCPDFAFALQHLRGDDLPCKALA